MQTITLSKQVVSCDSCLPRLVRS